LRDGKEIALQQGFDLLNELVENEMSKPMAKWMAKRAHNNSATKCKRQNLAFQRD
jgi:hypothetical protein